MNGNVTYVTCCVDINRQSIDNPLFNRHFEMYKRGYEMNARTKLPLVAFSSVPVTEINLPSYRNESNFLPIHFTSQTLQEKHVHGKLFEAKYPDPDVYKDGILSLCKWYGPLVSMKMYMMKEAIKMNPFNTDYFAWIDCQVTAGMQRSFDEDKMCEKFSRGIENILSDKKFSLYTLSGPQLTRVWKFDPSKFVKPDSHNMDQCIYGFFWGTHKNTFVKLYKKYFDLYRKFMLNNTIPTEELLFNILSKNYPEYIKTTHLGNSEYKTKILELIEQHACI
jgi:hypothetical protein